MKSALALLALTTAIATSVFTSLSAAPIAGPDALPATRSNTATPLVLSARLVKGTSAAGATEQSMQLAENDDDDEGGWPWSGHRHGEHHDDDDDEGACAPGQVTCAPGMNPARAGQSAPPTNGLFKGGVAPSVQMN